MCFNWADLRLRTYAPPLVPPIIGSLLPPPESSPRGNLCPSLACPRTAPVAGSVATASRCPRLLFHLESVSRFDPPCPRCGRTAVSHNVLERVVAQHTRFSQPALSLSHKYLRVEQLVWETCAYSSAIFRIWARFPLPIFFGTSHWAHPVAPIIKTPSLLNLRLSSRANCNKIAVDLKDFRPQHTRFPHSIHTERAYLMACPTQNSSQSHSQSPNQTAHVDIEPDTPSTDASVVAPLNAVAQQTGSSAEKRSRLARFHALFSSADLSTVDPHRQKTLTHSRTFLYLRCTRCLLILILPRRISSRSLLLTNVLKRTRKGIFLGLNFHVIYHIVCKYTGRLNLMITTIYDALTILNWRCVKEEVEDEETSTLTPRQTSLKYFVLLNSEISLFYELIAVKQGELRIFT